MWSTRWWPTAWTATSRWPPPSPAGVVRRWTSCCRTRYGDVTDRQLPVARFSLWAHLRVLVEEDRAVVDAAAGADTIESRWSPD